MHDIKNTLPRLIPPLCIGSIISKNIIIHDRIIILLLISCFFINIISLIYILSIDYVKEKVAGIIIIMNLILLAVCLQITDNRCFYHYKNNSIECKYSQKPLLQAISRADEKKNYYRIKCRIINSIYRQPDVYININKKDISYIPKKGHTFYINKELDKIKESKQNNGFDFKQYCFYNNIGYCNYIYSSNISINDTINKSDIRVKISSLQAQLLNILKLYAPDKKTYSIASAIILGYNDISDETRKSFTTAGTVHVLCVSGLHIATIYLLISFIFNLFNFKNIKKYISSTFSIIVLWGYTVLTGLSPSVTRAALMLSMITIGKIFNIKNVTINNIAGSAIILILINPDTIFQIGSQMSFAAITGICLFQDKFALIYKNKNENKKNLFNYIKNKILDIISVSIAVQIIITPIILYYFHTFSTYFLISNILAIPLATIILYLGISLLFLHFIPILNKLIGYIFYQFIKLLITSTEVIEKSPYSIANNINIDIIMLILIFIIIMLIRFILDKGIDIKHLIFSLAMIIILLGYNLFSIIF